VSEWEKRERERERERERRVKVVLHAAQLVSDCLRTYETHSLQEAGYSGMSPAFCLIFPPGFGPFFEKEQTLSLFIKKRAKPETFRIPIVS
jgi:hypothetical protein